VEARGEYRDGVYQELARGYGVGEYRPMLATAAANQTRLKTPSEMKGRDFIAAGGEDFAGSLLRLVLYAVWKTAEAGDPREIVASLRRDRPDFWEQRATVVALLEYLTAKPSAAMTHWEKDRSATELLLGSVKNQAM